MPGPRACLVLVVAVLAGCREPAAVGPAIDLLRARPDEVALETRKLVFGGGDRSFLRGGWSINEGKPSRGTSYIWAIARESTVSVHLLDPREMQFLVRLAAFPARQPLHVTVLVAGEVVSDFTAVPELREYRFVVPARLLHRGDNLVTFRHSALFRRPDGRDRRSFAASYAWLLFGPNCVPLRPKGEPPSPAVAAESTAAALRITGPAEISWKTRVPPDGRLSLGLRLPAPVRGPARVEVRVADGDTWRTLASERIGAPLLRREARRRMAVDLASFGGRDVVLRLVVAPEPCAATVATVVLEEAALLTGPAAAG
jgi:hypothetical protein